MGLTVLNEDIRGVPEDKWHRSSWLSDCLFGVVPRIAIAKDSTCSISIDVDALSGEDDPCRVILKSNWVEIVAPIVEIIRRL